MRRTSLLGIILLYTLSQPGQSISAGPASPKDIVDQLWLIATRGDLLAADGWEKASTIFFTNPTAFPGTKTIVVMSNEWGPAPQVKIEGDTADIIVGYSDKGTIDSALRYSPAAKTDAIKTSAFYHLVMVPTYAIMYAPDGKTVISKKPTGSRIWQIQGSPSPPWTTVNTAIRYVLEMKNKAADPSVRRNADQTLSSLLKLQ